jgi:hypothetical protein
MKRKSLGLILAALLLSITAQAVDIVNFDRRLSFSKSTESKEITFSVEKSCMHILLNIRSTASSGKISLELIAPDNKVIDKFSLGTQVGDDAKEEVTGQISKRYKNPKVGIWKIRIVTNYSTANVFLSTNVVY